MLLFFCAQCFRTTLAPVTAKIVTQIIFLVRAPAHVSRHGADLWGDCPQGKEELFDRPCLCLVDFASFLFSSSSVLFVTSP